MKSFTIKLQDFFKLNNDNQDIKSNFDLSKKHLLIPMYQREYKWTRDKVQVLINDINQRNKFLGILILDETSDGYEIVDGQQRITTCFLALVALYNYYNGSPMEQKSLLGFIHPYEEYILKNDSVGEYVTSVGNSLKIEINKSNDIYYQKETFETSYKLIFDYISELATEKVREFKRQLLDCEVLVLINDQHGTTCPVEQIFLDINEKSQLLEVENIFKGHCFENFEKEYYDTLKEKWTKLKHCGMKFKHDFGFKDVSQYLYLYLLECYDKDIPENLSPNDRHFLEGKNMDQTLSYLNEMINFGENVISFREKLDNTEYRFNDLCKNSHEYRHTSDHLSLKCMSSFIIDYDAAQYQKIPFMHFINAMSLDDNLQKSFTHLEFRKAIVNLYIYSALFAYSAGRKSKKDIDQTVLHELRLNDVKQVVLATKKLRTDKVEGFKLTKNSKEEVLRFVYSVSDCFDSNHTWLPELYVNNNGYTPEHFLIPDNKRKHICWKVGKISKNIYLTSKYTSLKRRAINFLILDRKLNEDLLDYDIVTKIEMIKAWFDARKEKLPNHVNVVIQQIEGMDEYQNLVELKTNPNVSENVILSAYNLLLDKYFDEEFETSMLLKLTECFKFAFRNQDGK